MENYNQQYGYGAQPTITLTHSVSKVMRSVYMRMFLGLLVTAGVAIFIGLTAWDTQKIKQMVQYSDSSQVGKIATIGALTLYLDFINLFLYMLRFFGNSRN